jgi:hypothetical protein
VAVWLPLALSHVPSMYRISGSRMAPYMAVERKYNNRQKETTRTAP